MYEDLNNGEKIVLNAIFKYIDENIFPPSIRDLCKLTGYKSTSTVQDKLKALEQKGYIESVKNAKRTLRIKKLPVKGWEDQ